MEMFFTVKSYGHYTDDEIWEMSVPYFTMTYHFAAKAMKLQAQMIAAYMNGAQF